MDTVYRTYNVYHALALDYWYRMGPMEYGYLLIFIGICGWLLMKSGMKR